MARKRKQRQFDAMLELQKNYAYYYNTLRMLTTSLFKWEGLPDTVPERFVEKTLFSHGQIAFAHDDVISYIVAKCNGNYSLSMYDEPNSYNLYGNGYSRNFKAEECVIIRNNIDCVPTHFYVDYFANKLSRIQQSIDSNLELQKYPIGVACDETQKLTMENFIKSYEGGEPFILKYKDSNFNGIETINFNVPFIADKLNEMADKYMTKCLTTFGINNANTSKKERLNADEVNSNNQYLDLNADSMLLFRDQACKEINEKYGLNVSVKMREERVNMLNEFMGEGEGNE